MTRRTTLETGHGALPALSRMHLPTSLAYWKGRSLYLDLVVGVATISRMTSLLSIPIPLGMCLEALTVMVRLGIS